MTSTSSLLDLSNIRSASNAKREVDGALFVSFIGIFLLLLGIGLIRLNIQEIIGSWLTTSGFIMIVYSLIKLIVAMVN